MGIERVRVKKYYTTIIYRVSRIIFYGDLNAFIRTGCLYVKFITAKCRIYVPTSMCTFSIDNGIYLLPR